MAIKSPARKRQPHWSKQDILLDLFSRRYTEEAYLTLSDMGNYPLELSEGRLVVPEMPTPRHQTIVTNVWSILNQWATQHNAGRAYVAPMPVRLWPNKFREPDVMFYQTEHLTRVKDKFGEAPDLVVEVLSPGTTKADLGEKLFEYAEAGIPEYWIVDLAQQKIHLHVLQAKTYALGETVTAGARCRAHTLPDLEFDVSRVFTT
jgi:Uma2 family endonuclease